MRSGAGGVTWHGCSLMCWVVVDMSCRAASASSRRARCAEPPELHGRTVDRKSAVAMVMRSTLACPSSCSWVGVPTIDGRAVSKRTRPRVHRVAHGPQAPLIDVPSASCERDQLAPRSTSSAACTPTTLRTSSTNSSRCTDAGRPTDRQVRFRCNATHQRTDRCATDTGLQQARASPTGADGPNEGDPDVIHPDHRDADQELR